jgi:uncharacterized protein YjbI with pentapeptide repeats
MKRPISLIAASLIAFGGLSGAQAFDEGQLQAVKTGQKECPGCDLSNAYLKDLDLRMVNLAGANLEGAVFYWSNLAGANLKGAKLTNARFEQVDLSEVSLEGVNLAKAWCDWATKLPAGSGWTCDGIVLVRK